MAAYEFCNDKGLVQKVELMLNNEERSDTVFLVNNARYHAWSHLVSMYSTVLEALMNEYFAHCEDREIKIRNVKHEDSFYLVLQYMYGVKMNFTVTNINVICEALSLSERFEMTDFSKELKQFVSTKIDMFDIEAVVSLLNTSRKYNLNDLYEKVTEYAYKNAEQLVKHASFMQLQYEVLVDLLKSDWFFAKEIEILTGVLTWHDDMDVKRGVINADETIGQDIDEQDGDDESQSTAEEQNLGITTDTLSVNNKTHPDIISGAGSSTEPSGQASDENNTDNAHPSSSVAKDLTNLVKSFKENVLKSLLSHIRAVGITTVDFLMAFETDLFMKYKDILSDYKQFSQSTQPRKEYVLENTVLNITSKQLNPVLDNPVLALHNKYFNKSGIFTINRLRTDTIYESQQEMQIGSFKLKLDLKESSPLGDNCAHFDIHIKCTSDKEDNWQCYSSGTIFWTAKCDECLRFAKKYPGKPVSLFHRCDSFKLMRTLSWKYTFTPNDSRTHVGKFVLDLSDRYCRPKYEDFVFNNVAEKNIKLKLSVDTFQIKKLEGENPMENQEVDM